MSETIRPRKKPPKPPKDPSSRAWILNSDGKVACFKDPSAKCTVLNLWELKEPMPFHDEELMNATKKISAILEDIEEKNRDPKRQLSFIEIRGHLLLAWTECGAISSEDDDEVIAEAFGLDFEC
jgi:hypothetical protein